MAQHAIQNHHNQIGDEIFGDNDNLAVFTDRVQVVGRSTADLVDRSFTGNLDAFVYPNDLMGRDFCSSRWASHGV